MWSEIDNLDVFKLPRYVKYLAAPYVREEADVPVIVGMCQIIENNELVEVPNYRFKFLSNYCAKLISEKAQNDLHKSHLQSFQFDYLLAESIVINGGNNTTTTLSLKLLCYFILLL